MDFDNELLPVERTLGVFYDAERDCFCFRVNPDAEANTKRQMLSSASSVYDPDGLVSPVTIKSRCILQDMWRSKTDWDKALEPGIKTLWNQWVAGLIHLSDLKIPRAFSLHRIHHVEMCVFADASQLAYGAVIFIRFERPEGAFGVSFITSKVHVASTRHITIPRLELKALLLAVRLSIKTKPLIQYPVTALDFFSDSKTTLYWCKSYRARFTPFVANRVGEIQEHVKSEQLHHVPGVLNPADDCSRGLIAAEFIFMDPSSCIFLRKMNGGRRKWSWKSQLWRILKWSYHVGSVFCIGSSSPTSSV